jgi:hypothetical protein
MNKANDAWWCAPSKLGTVEKRQWVKEPMQVSASSGLRHSGGKKAPISTVCTSTTRVGGYTLGSGSKKKKVWFRTLAPTSSSSSS